MGSRGARSRSDASAELILARESRTGGPPFPRGSLRELLGHEAEQSPGAEERLLRRRHRQPEELLLGVREGPRSGAPPRFLEIITV